MISVREDITKIDLTLKNNVLSYHPKKDGYFEFLFGIKYGNRVDTLSIKPVIPLTPQFEYIQNPTPILTSKNHYVSVTQSYSKDAKLFNHQMQKTRQVNVTGLHIVLEPNSSVLNVIKHNPNIALCDEDIESISFYCDTLIFKTKLWLPQPSVTIYCKTLLFEFANSSDASGSNIGFINTQPTDFKKQRTADEISVNGDDGLKGGYINIFSKNIIQKTDEIPLFVSNGGKGQDGGPGKDGLDINTNAVGFTVTRPRWYFGMWPNYCNNNTEKNVIYEAVNRQMYVLSSGYIFPGRGGFGRADADMRNAGYTVSGDFYAKGNPNTPLKAGGRATPIGNPGLGGEPGVVAVCSETELMPSAVNAKTGLVGSYFGGNAEGLFYKGGKGETAKVFIQNGSPFHINDCSLSGNVTPFQRRDVIASNGESFPPVIDQSWKATYNDFLEGGSQLSPNKYYIENIYYKSFNDKYRDTSVVLERNKVTFLKAAGNNWLHPNTVNRELGYIREVYINGNLENTYVLLTALKNDINVALKDTANANYIEFSMQFSTINSLMNKIASNMDYFGNPAGYCPLLSLWVNKALYEKTVEKAIKDIILCKEISTDEQSVEDKKNGLKQLISNSQQQLNTVYTDLNDANVKLDGLNNEITDITNYINNIEPQIKLKEQEFLEMAKTDVEKAHEVPFFKKAVGVLATACKVIPVYQPVLGAIGEGLDIVNNFDSNNPIPSIKAAGDLYSQFSSDAFAKSRKDFLDKMDAFKKGDKSIINYGKDLYKNYNTNYAPAVQYIIDAAKDSKVDVNEIYSALEDIKAKDLDFRELTKQINQLTDKKLKLNSDLNDASTKISSAQAQIGETLVNIAKLQEAVDKADNEGIATQTMDLLNKIQKQSFERLLKYHYNLAKSYEYRMLEPYFNNLSFENEFADLKKP